MNQNEYITGLLTQDSKILEAIYQQFAPKITAFVLKNGGTRDDARDVFQDALVIIYKKAQQEDFELTSQFYTYLFGVCNNVWRKKREKK